MDVPSSHLGLEKGLTVLMEELIPLDLDKTSPTWICLRREFTSIKAFIIVEETKLRCSLQTVKASLVF